MISDLPLPSSHEQEPSFSFGLELKWYYDSPPSLNWKYYSDPRNPRSLASECGITTQVFQRGEDLKITNARFFPGDGAHKLEFKFKEPNTKMTVVIDSETVKVVELKDNYAGNAGFKVNGRDVEFAWDVSIYLAEFYFSYEGVDRIGIVGEEPK